MRLRGRLKRQAGRYALVDGVPFQLPISSQATPAFMAAFTIDADRARELLPGNELHPLKLFGKGVLIVAVIDYQITVIGKYIEFSVGIACTHGRRPAPPLLGGLFRRLFKTGQYVYDLPVSSEISVKGGKGIWGMPKHQANLSFVVGERTVGSQYDKDGKLVMKIEIDKPGRAWLPLSVSGVNYCAFRGMLMKSYIAFSGKVGISLFKKGSARLKLGSHPRAEPLKRLGISENPIFTGWFPNSSGLLDDHQESWFLSFEAPPAEPPEGMESVIDLGLSEEWLEPPRAEV